jgi:hypothetical protein
MSQQQNDPHIHHESDVNTENQPALQQPKVDRLRDDGSGLLSGTGLGVDSVDPYSLSGPTILGPGEDPHSGEGDGSGLTTGQYRGSDDGTTTDPQKKKSDQK